MRGYGFFHLFPSSQCSRFDLSSTAACRTQRTSYQTAPSIRHLVYRAAPSSSLVLSVSCSLRLLSTTPLFLPTRAHSGHGNTAHTTVQPLNLLTAQPVRRRVNSSANRTKQNKAPPRPPPPDGKSADLTAIVGPTSATGAAKAGTIADTTAGSVPVAGNVVAFKVLMKPAFYAVVVGRERGIYTTWDQCKERVHGFRGAIYKSFRSLQEARAFLAAHPHPNNSESLSGDGETTASRCPRAPPCLTTTRAYDVDADDEEDEVAAPSVPPTQRARVEPGSPIHNYFGGESARQASLPPPLHHHHHPRIHHQVVYVDGACSHNGTPNARAGYGGYYGSCSDPRNFALPVPPTEAQTNNRGELRAVIHAIVQGFVDAGAPRAALEASHSVAPNWGVSGLSQPPHRLVIHTDSRYVIDGLTRYSKRWVSNGFRLATKEPVLNQDLWKQLIRLRDAYNTCYALQHQLSTSQPPKTFHVHNTHNDETEGIELRHVKGHSNDPGNEMADSLAVEGSRKHDRYR
jgi:ribonuclease HI